MLIKWLRVTNSGHPLILSYHVWASIPKADSFFTSTQTYGSLSEMKYHPQGHASLRMVNLFVDESLFVYFFL